MKFRLFWSTIILIPVLIGSPLKGKSQARNISNDKIIFIENSWPQALKKASAEHKNIFVDAYASWCGPCKQMKATTFTNKKVAAFFNSNFINLSIDTEKGEGVKLTSQWGLESYPTLYIFNEKGKLLLSSEGLMDAADLLKFGEGAVNK